MAYELDPDAADIALDSLSSLPFGDIIGGPLVAAIEAQELAAYTTVNYIQEVAFNEDENGNKEVINVDFSYQKGEETFNLIVPLLTLVPIPYIEIDEMTIQFTANIDASAEQSSSTISTTEATSETNVKYSSFWSPVKAKFNANFSTKKQSKAAQNSKYSVEYTVDVFAHATGTDMPSGTQKVLQILTDSISSASASPVAGGIALVLDPQSIFLDGTTTTEETVDIQVTLADSQNQPLDGVTVTLTGAEDPEGDFTLAFADDSPATDSSGVATTTLTITMADASNPVSGTVAVTATATIEGASQETTQSIQISGTV